MDVDIFTSEWISLRHFMIGRTACREYGSLIADNVTATGSCCPGEMENLQQTVLSFTARPLVEFREWIARGDVGRIGTFQLIFSRADAGNFGKVKTA